MTRVHRRTITAAFLLLATLAATLAPSPAIAHQQKRAITTIAVNPRTRSLEVMHQLPVHDAEHALRRQGVRAPDIIASEQSREAFARYITTRFTLAVNGKPATLRFVGSEITGGSLWVYQEAPAPPPGATLTVNSQIFTDIWSAQENRVNLGAGATTRTLLFQRGTPPQEGMLPR